MTQTTPATDSHDIAGYTLTIHGHPGGVHSLHVAHAGIGGREIAALHRSYPTRDEAIAAKRNAYRFFASGGRVVENATGGVDLVPATVPAPRTEVKLAPPAQSTTTKVTDPGLVALQIAIADGYIHRGGGIGRASVTLLQALAKRGHLDLDVQLHGRRKDIKGGRITRAGRIAVLRETGADQLTYALSA